MTSIILLTVVLPFWAIIRMATHKGISTADRVLWVVVIFCMSTVGALAYFIWEATRGRRIRDAERERVGTLAATGAFPAETGGERETEQKAEKDQATDAADAAKRPPRQPNATDADKTTDAADANKM